HTRRGMLVVLLVCLAATTGCVRPSKHPNLPRIFEPARQFVGKAPIIVIPGALGSQLVNPKSGQVVWPSRTLYSDDDIELPISTDLPSNQDGLMATRIVDTTKLSLLLPEIRVYSDLLETLERTAGYRRGSIDLPPSDGAADTYYVFYYDWRRDNVENARVLARKIDALKASLGRPDLRFNIIAHSMGGLIARYYALYGDQDMSSTAPMVPDWRGGRNISRLLLVGTPNRGSMDALRSLVEGYNWYGGDFRRNTFFNKLDASLLFSLPSVYQLLPFSRSEHYVTSDLTLSDLNLYDPVVWKNNGWSVYAPKHRKSTTGRLGAAGEARLRDEEAFLAAALNRAHAFHEAIERVPDAPRPFAMFLFGGDCEPTLQAPLVVQRGNEPRTYFRASSMTVGRRRIDRKQLYDLMYAPGDGRVTRSSLLAERLDQPGRRLFPSALDIDYAVFACETHGDLPNNFELQNNILSILVTDTTTPGALAP
ncbi:MAG TPA: hypothetical protein PLF26_01930, partial [Blastocatellia bacterium]|nr:hypothetical protein [Blastocatellia bacterium]